MAKTAVVIRNQDLCAEILLIVLACFAPWAYGSVDASSEYVIYSGLLAVVGLRTVADWRAGERSLGSGPLTWSLAAIVALAMVQAVPLSEQWIRTVSPGTVETRLAIVPDPSVTVRGDSEPRVEAPSSTISVDPGETWHALVRLAAIFLLFDSASRSRLRFAMFEWFAKALVVNSALLAMFSLAQALLWNGKIYWIRDTIFKNGWQVGGPFFCHNHLAANLNIGLGLSLGLLFTNLDLGRFRGRGKLGRFFLVYTTGLITVGVVGSQSRGGMVAMAVSLLVVIAMLRARPSRVLPALAAILALAIVFLMSIGTATHLARLGTISDALTTALNGRAEVWAGAFETWKTYPVMGSGLGTFAKAAAPHYNPVETLFYGKFAAHGESEYVEMLVEGGLVGLGFLFVAVLDLLRKALLALRHAPATMRPLILGGLFGVSTIATQSLADFPLHVAGVTVPAVILASKLYRLGSWKEPRPEEAAGALATVLRLTVGLKNAALLATAGVLIHYQASQVKLEHLVERARLPLPGSQWITIDIPSYPRSDLEAMKTALTKALRIRPDWAEGHTRLGQVRLGLYRHAAADALGIALITVEPDIRAQADRLDSDSRNEPAEPDPEPIDLDDGDAGKSRFKTLEVRLAERAASLNEASVTLGASSEEPDAETDDGEAGVARADPLWLHRMLHSLKTNDPESIDRVIEHEPVRDFLIPAARSFLEARRCCPLQAVPSMQLAGLDYLLDGKETGLDHLKRAILLKGNQPGMLLVGAQLAADFKDLPLAVESWRDYLRQRPQDWALVADHMSESLKPDQILEVARGGGVKTILPIGVRLYSGPLGFVYRVRFMEAALDELPQDATLDDDERIWFEGRVRGELAQYDAARRLMRLAIDRQPLNSAWRLEYIDALMSWNCHDEAYRLALMGSRYFPRNWRFPKLMRMSLNEAVENGWSPRQLAAGNLTYDR